MCIRDRYWNAFKEDTSLSDVASRYEEEKLLQRQPDAMLVNCKEDGLSCDNVADIQDTRICMNCGTDTSIFWYEGNVCHFCSCLKAQLEDDTNSAEYKIPVIVPIPNDVKLSLLENVAKESTKTI